MRELLKILLEIRKTDPSITKLLSSLHPKYFDIFVEATKLNMTSKNVCDTNWSYEVSSHAANNLKLNKWNKVTIVPLASDLPTESLKILQKSLKDKQVRFRYFNHNYVSTQSLECTEMSQLFNNLVESVILLNRRRGELQRMYLHTYINASSNMKNFTHAVSQPEEILLKSLKRVVIRGKRGRGVPTNKSESTKKPKRILVPWSDEQKRVTTDFFKDHIKKKRSPKRNECEVLKSMFQI
nr:unnamed protein product [Callosobruchus analis]